MQVGHLTECTDEVPFSFKTLNVYLFLRVEVGREETEDPSRLCPVNAEPSVGLELTHCEIVT